jgi:hypothetical protein
MELIHWAEQSETLNLRPVMVPWRRRAA